MIDLKKADLALFDTYEARVLALLAEYGARLDVRLRAADASRELHVLYFPSQEARQGYLFDPRRLVLREGWERCGARAEAWEAGALP